LSEGPDFIGVGVQKCGTTWLGARLAEHPEVFFDKKEISFFSNHFHKGYDWYHRHFAEKGDRLAGEFSINYFITPRPDSPRIEHYPRWSFQSWFKHLVWRYPAARDEIRRMYPGIKVLAVFRNPADRAWSHYWMWHERRRKTGKARLIVPFRKFFEDNGRWARLTGRYGTLLRYWLDAFPEMGVFLHDDLLADPQEFLRSVYRFLGVDESFAGRPESRENAREYDPMPEGERRFVLDAYRDEIERFYELIGHELDWLDGA
jgi:hypothetical protein